MDDHVNLRSAYNVAMDPNVFEGGFNNGYGVHQDNGLRASKRLSHKHQPRRLSWTHTDESSHRDSRLSPEQSPGHPESASPRLAVLEDDLLAVNVTMPPSLERSVTGLPPTPPTTTDASASDLPAMCLTSDPHFADAVRSALHPQSSNYRISTPGAFMPPHTPDASPPINHLVEQKTLHLPIRPHALHAYPSSRGESYHTAHESLSNSHIRGLRSQSSAVSQAGADEQAGQSQDSLLSIERAPRYDGIRATDGDRERTDNFIPNLQQRKLTVDRISVIDSSPGRRQYQLGESSSTECSDTPSVRQSPHSSVSSDKALEDKVNISTQRNHAVHDFERDHSRDQLRGHSTPAYLDLLFPLPSTEKHVSVEDVNNLVYQHIQQANVRKHGIVESGGAMPVGVIDMRSDTHHTLKRTTKCLSLRENASDGSPRSSIIDSLPRLKYGKRSLQSSPIVEKDKLLQRHIAPRHASSPLPARSAFTQGSQTEARGFNRLELFDRSYEHQHTLRRSRKVDGLQKASYNGPLTVNDKDDEVPESSLPYPPATNAERKLRRFSHEHKLENLRHSRHISEESYSPRRKDFDMRLLHPSPTPMSQFSDRTEAEVLEARGVSIFPHNNESLLVVQNGSRTSSKTTTTTPSQDDGLSRPTGINYLPSLTTPQIRLDSPLTHPRPAPDPPIVAVIPPTPNDEMDRQLFMDDDTNDEARIKSQPQPNLFQRARRYSEGFVQPFLGRSFSLRKQPQSRPSTAGDERPANLSPFWKPRYFWEDVESDEEYDEYGDYNDEYYHESALSTLPRGGDTSNVEDVTRRLFPRNLSVRMPGFRGNGGFLVGNSLGLDRHGTNNRRHYVVRRRASEEVLRRVSKEWNLTLPFTGGKQLRYVGLTRWKRRLIGRRLHKQDQDHDRRCQALKGQIQH